MQNYEYIVIGNGLMGSAAARYLSQWSDSVALIGPGEPDDQSQHQGVFSSHYDQGRLAHKFSRDPIWAVISAQAVTNYPKLEAQSGIRFHGPVGRIHAAKFTDDEKAQWQSWMAAVDPTREQLHYFAAAEGIWPKRFPYLNFPADYDLFHEAAPAGYVNPREMLRAQNKIAQQQGATLISEQVTRVTSASDSVTVITGAGQHISGQKALIACGAFTNFNNLLPEALPLRLKTESMVWGTVSEGTAQRLSAMPGVGYDIQHPEIDDIYIAPPLRYPDGTFKIKMGCNTTGEIWPTTLAEVQAWFQQGNGDPDLPEMAQVLQEIFPDVEFLEMTPHRCIVTYTPSGYPTIDQVPSDEHGRLFVATGGNGSGAGGSDTLGHLAAGLIFDGRWIDGLPRDVFRAALKWGESEGKKVLSKAQARALHE